MNNNKIKIISAVLASLLVINPLATAIQSNTNVAKASNYESIKVGDKIFVGKKQQTVRIIKDDYLITDYIEGDAKVYNVVVRNKKILTKEEQDRYLRLAKKDIASLPQSRAVPVIPVIALVISAIGVSATIDNIYFKAERDEILGIEDAWNGWLSMSREGKTLWFYKERGKFKKGWHWDSNYNGWYYFYDVHFMFLAKTVLATMMFDPEYRNSSWLKINNKWYEFESGGKLIQHSGWREYNGRWLYHVPGDYGAVANQGLYIGNTWYEFDSNGYWKG